MFSCIDGRGVRNHAGNERARCRRSCSSPSSPPVKVRANLASPHLPRFLFLSLRSEFASLITPVRHRICRPGGETYAVCTVCSLSYHTNCLSPPVTHLYRCVSWVCPLHQTENMMVRCPCMRSSRNDEIGPFSSHANNPPACHCKQRRKQVKPERSLDELDAPDAARIVLRNFRAKLTADKPPPTPAQERKEVGFSESYVLLFRGRHPVSPTPTHSTTTSVPLLKHTYSIWRACSPLWLAFGTSWLVFRGRTRSSMGRSPVRTVARHQKKTIQRTTRKTIPRRLMTPKLHDLDFPCR